MVKESEDIFLNSSKLCWYMRGGMQITDIMNMSHGQIDIINKIIDENMETTKKTKLPFF